MTQDQILNICMNSGGLLGSRVSNFVGLLDQMKYYGIKGSDSIRLINSIPEFALQNRQDLFRLKIETIKKESGRDEIYIRNFIKRHPDIVLK